MNLLTVVGAIALFVANAPASALSPHGGSHSHSSSSTTSEHAVRGYTTKNGTYVAPHYQTNPDGTRNDNYSTRGNVNPHTGEAGTKPRDGETPPL